MVGFVVTSIFLGLAYREGLDKWPLFSVFLLLSLVHFVYSLLALIFFAALILRRAKEVILILQERAMADIAVKEDENKLKEALKEITDRKEVELMNEECAVCLADLFKEDGSGEVSQIKKCGHVFHTVCIE